MKVIFLDFDGVMDTAHYDNYLNYMGLPENDKYGVVLDPDCIANLKRIIDATGADIVVSSTWKDFMTYREILEMWEYRQLPGFVTDTTPTCSRKRGDEIDRWLEDCKTECEYVIIDDMDETQFNEHQYPKLFIVNPYDGLNELTADRIIQHFKNNEI